jgi:biopolymer transport protein ExbB
MSDSFGLSHIWLHGDAVTRAIMALLIGMSIVSWIVIVLKALDVWRYKQQALGSEAFWHSHSLSEGLNVLGSKGNLFHDLAITGQEATDHHQAAQKQLHDRLDVSDWVTRSLRNAIDDSTGKLQNGLAVLASIGSTAPFVGLFGTVWGIYHALVAIGATGNAGIDAVAGPIGETLIMTALGLAVAIPHRPHEPLCPRPARLLRDRHPHRSVLASVQPDPQQPLNANTAPHHTPCRG